MVTTNQQKLSCGCLAGHLLSCEQEGEEEEDNDEEEEAQVSC
jgi:hypothetical protein